MLLDIYVVVLAPQACSSVMDTRMLMMTDDHREEGQDDDDQGGGGGRTTLPLPARNAWWQDC